MTATFDFETKRGDTADVWQVTLNDKAGPADLTGNLGIRLLLRDRATKEIREYTAELDDPDPTTGKVKYEFKNGGSIAGWFDAEWEVTRSDGTIATYPISGYMLLRVWEDLG